MATARTLPIGVRSVCGIVPWSMPKELPPYMSLSSSDTSSGEAKPALRMLMFGKPCAGKGTLAARLSRKYDILAISTGDLLRQHISERTDIGRQAEGIVATGGLLSDELMLDLVASKLDTVQTKNWILDGFPRTQRQGRLLDNYLQRQNTPLNLVVNVDVPDDVILSWIVNRWVHLPSGRVYSTSYNPPKVPGLDDVTGEPLMKRPDDNPDIFSRRLEHYYAQTLPLLYYFASRAYSTPLLDLCGDSDSIWSRLESTIVEYFPGFHERATPPKPRVMGQPQVRRSLQ
ncbi:ADK-domain-containing protein [Phlebopus sp. FC_14]|nr:ADK-domain-containing protein [Phlebopus sp. FC_14]